MTTFNKLTIKMTMTVLGFAVLTGFTGCGGNYSSDMTVNGVRTVTKKNGDQSRSFTTSNQVVFEAGKIKTFDPGTIITLTETISGKTTEAELRDEGGELKLFVKHGETLEPATDKEAKWADTFFAALALDDRPDEDVAVEKIRETMETSSLASALDVLEDMSMSSEQEATLLKVIDEFELSADDEVAVVEAAMEHLSFASSQVPVIVALIERPGLSDKARDHIASLVDKFSKSQQETITEALSQTAQ